MLKGHSNSHVRQEAARFNDTDIKQSYIVMEELKRGMSLHSYSYQEDGDWACTVKLVYTTLDGKKHQLCSTEIKL